MNATTLKGIKENDVRPEIVEVTKVWFSDWLKNNKEIKDFFNELPIPYRKSEFDHLIYINEKRKTNEKIEKGNGERKELFTFNIGKLLLVNYDNVYDISVVKLYTNLCGCKFQTGVEIPENVQKVILNYVYGDSKPIFIK